MSCDFNQICRKAKEFGAAAAGVIKAADINFDEGFRFSCEQNYCGKYGTNWMCPPGVGAFEELKANVLSYKDGVVFQTVYQMEDSFDFEGMTNAADIHDEVFKKILNYIRSEITVPQMLALNAGPCKVCKDCTYPQGLPCRFPDKAVSSVEANGIDVNALVTLCGIPYNNGTATVSYVGLFLFK